MPGSEIAGLCNNPKFCDVTFIVGESKSKVFANKAVLAIASSVFDAMLYGDMREASQNTIELDDVEPDAFISLLKFIYGNNFQLTDENIESILYCAKKYAVVEAEQKCEEFFAKKMNDENVFSLLDNADLYSMPNLAQICMKHICQRANDIVEKGLHLPLSKRTFSMFLERNDLRIKEATVAKAVVSWAKHRSSSEDNEEEAHKRAREFMPLIRFSAIKAKDLVEQVFPLQLLTLEEQLKMLSEKVVLGDKPVNPRRGQICDYVIKKNASFKQLLDDGWRVVYQHMFSHSTNVNELLSLKKEIQSEDSKVCVAAKVTNSDILALSAYGPAHEVLKYNGSKNNAVRFGQVCWYFVERESFGFAEREHINLNSADTISSQERMSWHLSGGGGYRIGDATSLNNSSDYEKLILLLD